MPPQRPRQTRKAPSPVTRHSLTARATSAGKSFSSATACHRRAAAGSSKRSASMSPRTMPASVSTITAGRPLWALRICSFSGAAAQNLARLTGSSASCLNSWSSSQASPRYQTRFRSTLAAWSSGSRTVSPRPCAGSISSQLCSIFLILSVQRIFSPFSGRKKAPAAFRGVRTRKLCRKIYQKQAVGCVAVAWRPQRTPAFRRLATDLSLRFFRCFAVLPFHAAKPKLPCACSACPAFAFVRVLRFFHLSYITLL